MNEKIITVCGEEEYMVSHVNYFWYVEMDSEFIETPCQTFKVNPPAATEDVYGIPKVTKVLPIMVSLKDAKVVVEENGCTTRGQLLEIPYKFDKLGLGFSVEGQRVVLHACAGRSPFRVSNNGVNVIEDAESYYDLDSWIFPTIGNEISNWKAQEVISISFSRE